MMNYDVITFCLNDDGHPERIIDKICAYLAKKGIIRVVDGWGFEKKMPDGSSKVCGATYTIAGNSTLVKVLSALSDCRGKGSPREIITVDNQTGEIIGIRDYSG